MKNTLDLQYRYKNISFSNIYKDGHIFPQISFMSNTKWDNFDFNIIGNLKYLEDTLYNILQETNININKKNLSQLVPHLRDRTNPGYIAGGRAHFNLTKKELTDDMILLLKFTFGITYVWDLNLQKIVI